MPNNPENWLELRRYTPEKILHARQVLEEIKRGRDVTLAMRRYPLPGGGYLPKHILVAAYYQLVESGEWPADPALLARIRMKPVRTLSGVTTVTVLTKEYPCPGKCVFCPTEARMPKSYLSDEPGARRGLQHGFDPYSQVHSRLQALDAVGHPTDKIELLILGGTWSAYRRDYQEWFVRRCFEALNDAGSAAAQPSPAPEAPGLDELQEHNETAPHRNVGLVIETRPDEITPGELAWLRRLGVTKVQMGAQSLDDRVLGHQPARAHCRADPAGLRPAARGGVQNRAALDAQLARGYRGKRPAGFPQIMEIGRRRRRFLPGRTWSITGLRRSQACIGLARTMPAGLMISGPRCMIPTGC